MNKITEKYHGGNFKLGNPHQAESIIRSIRDESGFIPGEEVFRGKVYDSRKIGSIILSGRWKGKKAILKIQGLKLKVDEIDIIHDFENANTSEFIRIPTLFDGKKWDQKIGYGYLIMEHIDGKKIFEMPFASDMEMKTFNTFYREYRNCISPFPCIGKTDIDTYMFTMDRVNNWKKICSDAGKIKQSVYEPLCNMYFDLNKKLFTDIPMIFSHGHLTANDIFIVDNRFVVMSNLLWSYRPQWYDLGFNIWACALHIRNTDYSFEDFIAYVEKWTDSYKTIPLVGADPDFDRKLNLMLLERAIGSILTDLGANDTWDKKEMRPYFNHLFDLHIKWFKYLIEKI